MFFKYDVIVLNYMYNSKYISKILKKFLNPFVSSCYEEISNDLRL